MAETDGTVNIEARATSVSILLLLLLLERVAKVSDPIMLEAKKRVLVPDFEGKLDFIEQFHSDFKKVVSSYVGQSARVFIFVDDLDRCEVPKAADHMQGLNLLISDNPQILFIIGIDRRKVAAALAAKYEKLLPYFPTSVITTAEKQNGFDPTPGLEFGYSFLEKFIQVAFLIPRMTGEQLPKFLKSLDEDRTKNRKVERMRCIERESIRYGCITLIHSRSYAKCGW